MNITFVTYHIHILSNEGSMSRETWKIFGDGLEGIDFIVWVRMSLGEMGLSINWLSEKTGYSRETL